ncbi:MAG: enoyl-CoA hydratase family protein [Planctomycetota bacterium]|nr:MAG: enoyl-CoA hydratase family protein [Planctomycetota bacterium]
MNPQHFRYKESDGVALVQLDRPDKLNALTFASYRELTEAFRALQTRKSVRAVVLTGSGKAFCSGGDVEDIIGELLHYDAAQLNQFTRLTCDLIQAIRELEKPVVAALNGTTCGAGAVMAIAADIRIAAEHAKIAFLFVKVGLSGADMGAGWLLPRIVGLGHASELLMTGKFIDARRAAEIGLYNRVVAAEDLEREAFALARELAAGPALGLAVTKRMLNAEASMGLAQAMQAEGWIQALCMEHPDFKEGFAAAMARRPPQFAGAPAPMQAPRAALASAAPNQKRPKPSSVPKGHAADKPRKHKGKQKSKPAPKAPASAKRRPKKKG